MLILISTLGTALGAAVWYYVLRGFGVPLAAIQIILPIAIVFAWIATMVVLSANRKERD